MFGNFRRHLLPILYNLLKHLGILPNLSHDATLIKITENREAHERLRERLIVIPHILTPIDQHINHANLQKMHQDLLTLVHEEHEMRQHRAHLFDNGGIVMLHSLKRLDQ